MRSRKALRLGQIKLAVLERPPREFAALGQPQTQAAKGIQHARDHRAAAMHMKLGHVLAREARGTRKPKHERAVQDLSASRVAQYPDGGHPGLRGPAFAQSLERSQA